MRSYATKKNPRVWDKVARLAGETGQSEDSCRRRVLQLRQHMTEPLPDSHFRTSDNQEVSLADFKSPILLVNFFFPQCGPCNAEMPHLQRFYERYRLPERENYGKLVAERAEGLGFDVRY